MNDIIEFLKQIKDLNKRVGGDVYIVGGFIRDRLFNSKANIHDLDLVYSGDIEKFIGELNKLGYNFSTLKENKNTYRHKCIDLTIDISLINGDNIEDDLSKRDYTVNAICMKLIENKIIDPFKGRRAIKSRIIKQVNEHSLEDDPVRILRGIRMYINHGMHFNFDTEKKLINAACELKNCERQRVFDEFMKIIDCDTEGKAFEILDNYGVLKNMFPYIDELKTVGKCKYHIEDAFTHMNLTYQVFKDVLNKRISVEEFNVNEMYENLGEFNLKDYIGIACFLHDIGKFKCYKKEGDKVSFSGHEIEGANIVKSICEDMSFPKEAAVFLENIVEAHMIPLGIFKMNSEKQKQALKDFFNKYNRYVPYILIVSFCDNYATNMLTIHNDEKLSFKQFIQNLLLEYKRYCKKI
ncbi:HDIG domain-containing metalloprotein [Clostridium sp. JN-1]|uniref:HDIG domain-containing metalloprotein n=1 Tax=Clostridium sp. JN-1 TaxID=2483110 RepID=UPI000F0B1B30|nr:HDIG domain-containing metalloprotein [Clostridium sp. JN-1]